MITERSLDARSAKSVFFEDVNDIDIYIEDTAFGYEKLFTSLFSRVFEDQYRVNKIFPLGGRKSVIEQHSKDSSKRPCLYIIDGDLFLLIGDSIENQKGLFKFPFYCVENLLCDNNAIISILDEEEPVDDKKVIESKFDYNSWLSLNEDNLFNLFVEYAISMRLNPTEKTISLKVSDLVSSNSGDLDYSKLNDRISKISRAVIDKHNQEEYNREKIDVLKEFRDSGLSKLDVISGKDYIFPLLKMRSKSIVKTKISDLNFKHRLAKLCDISKVAAAKDFVAC